jgi:inosose dehydratase
VAAMAHRIVAAPISWGVCEVPGWGYQLEPDRVLGEMRDLGLTATELGPDGYLPLDPGAARDLLGRYGLRLVGGFVPAVLHRPDRAAALAGVERAAERLAAGGSTTMVLAADTDTEGYDQQAELDDTEWANLLDGLDEVGRVCRRAGLELTLHPHVGTVIERPAEVERILDDTDVALCLDTGHLLIGGTDPVALARAAPGRIRHVHLKDVDAGLAQRVASGERTYTDAVREGLYRPLGEGDIDMAAIVGALEGAGYTGWYVLEQDTILTTEPPAGQGPVRDVQASIDYLHKLASAGSGT